MEGVRGAVNSDNLPQRSPSCLTDVSPRTCPAFSQKEMKLKKGEGGRAAFGCRAGNRHERGDYFSR